MRTLAGYGVNMTGSVYPHAWALQYEVNDLDGMAKAYSTMFNNVNLERMCKYRVDSLIDGNCDGAFYHMNRSCKLMSFIQYEMERQVFFKKQAYHMRASMETKQIQETLVRLSLKQDCKG